MWVGGDRHQVTFAMLTTSSLSPTAPPLILRLRDLSLLYLSSSPDPRQPGDSYSYTSSPHSTASQPSDGSDPISARSGVSLSTSTSSFIHVPHPAAAVGGSVGVAGKRKSLSDMQDREKAAVGAQAEEQKTVGGAERHSMDVALRPPPPDGTTLNATTTATHVYLSAPDLDGDDDENYALREGRGWWAGIGPEHVADAEAGLKEVEALVVGGKTKGKTEM